MCVYSLTDHFPFSSRKGEKPGIYKYLKPVRECAMERTKEYQWNYYKLHCTSAEVPTCEWIKRVGAGGS